jgi:hypothetical protein
MLACKKNNFLQNSNHFLRIGREIGAHFTSEVHLRIVECPSKSGR